MRNTLTAKEISDKHGVSERTAYRWLADNDPRCDATPLPPSPTVSSGSIMLRIILEQLCKISLQLFRWVYIEAPKEKRERWEDLRGELWRAINALRKESGLYPPDEFYDGETSTAEESDKE